MPAYINPADLVKIAVISFAAVWLANTALRKVGMAQFTTTGTAAA